MLLKWGNCLKTGCSFAARFCWGFAAYCFACRLDSPVKESCMRWYGRISFSILVLLAFSCSPADLWPRKRVEIEIGGVKAYVEVARTKEERQKGLMHRTSLGPDEGMLFVFPEEKIQAFWMKNTLIPLDVAFFDSQGFLIDVFRMEPDGGERIYQSSQPALYAVEMNAGWFAEKDLRRFARLKLPYPVQGE